MVTGLRERKKEQTRDALIRSALLQFDERGFDHVTVEDIAGACEVSPRTFFRYFASKEDVLFVHNTSQCDRFVDFLKVYLPNPSLLDALRSAVVDISAETQGERDLVLLRHRITQNTPSLQSRLTEKNHSWETAILAAVRPKGRLDADAELRLRLTVAASMTALRVATETWVERGGRGDLTALLTAALDQLRDGI